MDFLADLFTVFGFAALFLLGTVLVDRFWALVELIARAYFASVDGYERLRGRQQQRNYELAARPYRPQARRATGGRTALSLRGR
jgi:hypothetical protein